MSQPVQYRHEVVTDNYEVLSAKIIFTTSKGTTLHVHIKKDITIREYHGRAQAKTYSYRYHANLPDGRAVLRYCSPDNPNTVVDPKNHHTYHHRHVFNHLGDEVQVQNVTGTNDWPHVGEFLSELLNSF